MILKGKEGLNWNKTGKMLSMMGFKQLKIKWEFKVVPHVVGEIR